MTYGKPTHDVNWYMAKQRIADCLTWEIDDLMIDIWIPPIMEIFNPRMPQTLPQKMIL